MINARSDKLKMIGRSVVLILLAIFVLSASYYAGYVKGGHDFAYLDHVLVGTNASYLIRRCERANVPAQCYRTDANLMIQHALVLYADYKNTASSLAPFAFPDLSDHLESSVKELTTYALHNDIENHCNWAVSPSIAAQESCMNRVRKITELLGTPKPSLAPMPKTNSNGR